MADSGPWLHDGRAKTLDQAIRLHGGEAQSIRRTYEALSPDDQAEVVGFLESLVAPNTPVPLQVSMVTQ